MTDPQTLGECSIKDLLTLLVQLQMRTCELLEEIREGLVVDATEESGCPHPEEKRVSLSSGGDLNHWVCAVCKFDNKADAVMN